MTINERVSPERLDTISAEYSRPNHAKNFSATDWEIAAMARELKELRNNNESLRGEVLIAHRTLMNQWAQLQQYRAAAEPVVYIGKQMLESLCDEGGRICGRVWRSNTDELSGESRIPLYASPQVTSVPEQVPESLKDRLLTICDLVEDNDEYCQDIWNACRAAMLSNVTLTDEGESAAPAVQAEQLSGNTEQAIDAAFISEFERLIHERDSEIDAGQLGSYSYTALLKAASDAFATVTGNSPAIPDGWIPVSERLPDIGTEIFYFCQDDGLRDCAIVSSSNFSGGGDAQLYVHAEGYDLRFGVDITHWMPLPAAPKQEAE